MRYVDEYRDTRLAKALSDRIRDISHSNIRLMEICGTHTMSIFRHGIRSILPKNIELISGPGCPVCVTAIPDMDRAIELSSKPDVILCTFGDMLRVPGSKSSLQKQRGKGAEIRVVYSPFEVLEIAKANPKKRVVFLGIGFETTAPTVAATLKSAASIGIDNLYFLSLHKILIPAMEALVSSKDLNIDGFICPGHVSVIIGSNAYQEFVKRYHKPCVIAGFEPLDILQAILMLVEQIENGISEVEVQYKRAVRPEGNPSALKVMWEVFEVADSNWRGLGLIPKSGLKIRKGFSVLDAEEEFELTHIQSEEPPGCRCGEVLRGAIRPPQCPLFKKICTPQNPIGACMVSSEGTCAAYFKYAA
mgnify:CR=1 FL=1